MTKRNAAGAVAGTGKNQSQRISNQAASLRVVPASQRKPRQRLDEVKNTLAAPSAAPQQHDAATLGGLMAVHVIRCDSARRSAQISFAGKELIAKLAPEVDPVVIHRAVEHREHVIAQQEGSELVILGVLRTSATPGIDVGDDYTIEARRVRIKAEHELSLSSGMARIALASLGRIESIAQFITSRASAVHKIIGRAIELN